MRHTKRTRRNNIKRLMLYYQRERGLSEIDTAADFPAFYDVLDDPRDLDFDDVVRVFDYLCVDLIAVPRGSRALTEWYSITDMPFDDGGRHRERDGVWMKRHRLGRERKKK